MDEFRAGTRETLPERGEPRLAGCDICEHQHACYVADRPGPFGPDGPSWCPFFACLGCLMRAADPAARTACAECVFPA
jgi:hypothetical protein